MRRYLSAWKPLLRRKGIGAVPCLVDTLTLAQNGPENARDHHAEEHLHR